MGTLARECRKLDWLAQDDGSGSNILAKSLTLILESSSYLTFMVLEVARSSFLSSL